MILVIFIWILTLTVAGLLAYNWGRREAEERLGMIKPTIDSESDLW